MTRCEFALKRRCFRLSVAVILLVSGHTLASARDLDELLQALQEQTGVPGIAAAVARDGELVAHAEVGFADVVGAKTVSPRTVFRLASVSKAVCSVIAAKLIEDDVIALDTPAGDLLPELPRQFQELSLRDLMTHTSGLPHYEPRDSLRGRKRYQSAVSGLEQLGDRPLASTTGETYLYSTHGFSLASAMMERGAGKTFLELFEGIVRSESELDSLTLESEGENGDRRTLIYEGARNGSPRELEREDFSYSWCGAGMESSATSLSLFASSLFGSKSLLRQQGQDLLVEPLPDRTGEVVATDRWTMTLGFRRSSDPSGKPFLHHAGVTNGARSILAVWPESRLAVALLSNASWTGRMEDTAVALALATTDAELASSCEEKGEMSYGGRFNDAPMVATIDWRKSEKGCRGQLSGENALAGWLSRFNFVETSAYPLIPISNERWLLVSPIGISILAGDATHLSGHLGSRRLTLEHTRP